MHLLTQNNPITTFASNDVSRAEIYLIKIYFSKGLVNKGILPKSIENSTFEVGNSFVGFHHLPSIHRTVLTLHTGKIKL